MSTRRIVRLIQASAVFALLGLALMVWSVLDPRPIPVMAAMSVGQGIGTLSFLLFVIAVLADMRRSRLLGAAPPPSNPPPSSAEASPAVSTQGLKQ